MIRSLLWTILAISVAAPFSGAKGTKIATPRIIRVNITRFWYDTELKPAPFGRNTAVDHVQLLSKITSSKRKHREFLSVGLDHTCGVSAIGAIQCSGNCARDGVADKEDKCYNGKEKFPAGGGIFTQVSAGSRHTCGLIAGGIYDGAVECFGSDKSGRSAGFKPRMPKIKNNKFIQVSAGSDHTCGVTSKREIECFGSDVILFGKAVEEHISRWMKFGYFNTDVKVDEHSRMPTIDLKGKSSFESPKNIVTIATGDAYTAALTEEGKFKIFPAKIPGYLKNCKETMTGTYIALSGGQHHICAVEKEQANIKCCGMDNNGKSDRYWEQLLKQNKAHHFIDVSAGKGFSIQKNVCGLTIKGAIVCMGDDESQKSNGGKEKYPMAIRNGFGTKFVQVAAGHKHTCGVTSSGTLECFGSDEYGQSFGHNPKIPIGTKSTFGQFFSPEVFVQMSVGESTLCGLSSEEAYIQCFGKMGNIYGVRPRIASGERKTGKKAKFIQVSTGLKHACGVADNGVLECFGEDLDCQSHNFKPVKATHGQFVQVSAGHRHTCGLTNKGQIECIGATQSESNPDQSKGCTLDKKTLEGGEFVQISAGNQVTCGLVKDGTVKCFGAEGHTPELEGKDYVRINVNDKTVCGVTKENKGKCCRVTEEKKIECDESSGETSSKFTQVVGQYGLTTDGTIECLKKTAECLSPHRHNRTIETFVEIGVRSKEICGLTSQGAIRCFSREFYTRAKIQEMVTFFDTDKDNMVSAEELKKKAGKKFTEKVETLFNKIAGKNGKMDIKELGIFMSEQHFFADFCPQGYTASGRDSDEDLTKCHLCPPGFMSFGGRSAQCVECMPPSIPTAENDRCINPFLEDEVNKLKESTEENRVETVRLWAREDIRRKYNDMMARRKKQGGNDSTCDKDSKLLLFPASKVEGEIENIEDTACIKDNRDTLVTEFCNFRGEMDSILKRALVEETTEYFFPNMCCKTRKDKKLETCTGPDSTVPPEKTIPFAGSQGGDITQSNLLVEVSEAVKKDGYIHNGMLDVLKKLKVSNKIKEKMKIQVNKSFEKTTFCNPLVIESPDGDGLLCQSLLPYGHILQLFREMVDREMSKIHKHKKTGLGTAGKIIDRSMPVKSSFSASQMKKALRRKDRTKNRKHYDVEINKMKDELCNNTRQISMKHNLKNIAVYFPPPNVQDIMDERGNDLRYTIDYTKSVDGKLFEANDISIQNITNRHAAVVLLREKFEDEEYNYLKDVEQKCSVAQLPEVQVKVKLHIEKEDNRDHCCSSRDFADCATNEDRCKFYDVSSTTKVTVTGTYYEIEPKKDRRRRLLQENSVGGAS